MTDLHTILGDRYDEVIRDGARAILDEEGGYRWIVEYEAIHAARRTGLLAQARPLTASDLLLHVRAWRQGRGGALTETVLEAVLPDLIREAKADAWDEAIEAVLDLTLAYPAPHNPYREG